MAERKLSVVITGVAKGAQDAFAKVNASADGMGAKLQSVGGKVSKIFKTTALGAGVLAVGVGSFLKGGADALIELERLGAQTEAVIKSTGGAAGVTAEQVSKYADSIEKATGVEAEGIISGQNMLLTFTNLKNGVGKGNDIFNQATDIMADMSVAMGTDASKTAVQLGKALNDPIKGISALSKVGVTFTDQQKAQIKAMVEAGDVAGAQKIILAELNKEFGGSAEAFGDTTAGKVQKLKNLFGDMQEELASRLLPIVTKVADWLADKIPAATALIQAKIAELGPTFDKIAGYARNIGDAFMAFVGAVRPAFDAIAGFVASNPAPVFAALGVVVAAAFGAWAISAGAAAVATLAAAAPVLLVVAGVALLAAGLVYAYQHFDGFRNVVDKVASFLTGTLWPALQTLGGWLADALPVAAGMARNALGWIIEKAQVLYAWFSANVLPILASVVAWFQDNLPVAAGIARDALEWIIDKARTLYAWFMVNVLPALTAVAAYLTDTVGPAFTDVAGFIGDVIQKARDLAAWFLVNLGPQLSSTADALSTVLGPAFDLAEGTIGTMIDTVSSLWDWLDKIITKAGEVKSAMSNIPGVGFIGSTIGGVIPGFAAGGRPEAGMPALVGESGPELFIPDSAGTIVPAAATRSVLGRSSGGGDVYNIDMRGASLQDGTDAGERIVDAITRYSRNQNRPVLPSGVVG